MDISFDHYTFDENKRIVKVNGDFYYIVIVDSLDDIENYANDSFRAYSDYGEEDWYTPKEIVSVQKNCDGTFTVVFKLDIVY